MFFFLCVFIFSFYKYIVNSKKFNNMILLLKKDKVSFTFIILLVNFGIQKYVNVVVIYDFIAEPAKNVIHVAFGYSQIMFNLQFHLYKLILTNLIHLKSPFGPNYLTFRNSLWLYFLFIKNVFANFKVNG